MTYRCPRCKEDKDESAFQMVPATNGKRYRRGICRPCTYRAYSKYQKKRVPIDRIRLFLEELVHHCGSQRAAAKRLGVEHPQLRHWLGTQVRYAADGRTYVQKTISRSSASLILQTLREVRDGRVHATAD